MFVDIWEIADLTYALKTFPTKIVESFAALLIFSQAKSNSVNSSSIKLLIPGCNCKMLLGTLLTPAPSMTFLFLLSL